MRIELDDAHGAPAWPDGFRISTWHDSDAPEVHALLVEAYRHGGGEVDPYETWLPWFTRDAEFDAAACLLARTEGGQLAGVVLCWSSAFVKDLCVAEAFRRRGLGEALLCDALRLFRERGAAAVELKVHAGNPTGAQRLYERVGFRVVEQIPPAP
jgi:ribosomal protein S18 acetylase RimI-like enzyme